MNLPLPLTTRRLAKGQIVFCQGCCCGRTDRGHPELPVELLKEAWRTGKLNRTVQLTISGCLGPCDLTNVALVITPGGLTWLGSLEGEATYTAFVTWARDCDAAGELLPLPDELLAHRFERYTTEATA